MVKTILTHTKRNEAAPDGLCSKESALSRTQAMLTSSLVQRSRAVLFGLESGKFLFPAFVLSLFILSGCSSAPIQRLQTEMLAEQQVINRWGRDFANLNEVTDRYQREHLAQIKELEP